VNRPDPGWPGDVELDLLLLNAKSSTLDVLDTSVDVEAGLAAIQAQHERGTASRPPPARAGPRPRLSPELDRRTKSDHHDHPRH
jgi:hypothetical protein